MAASATADDFGRSAAAFRDGREEAPGALRPPERERLAGIRARLDPDGLLISPRPLG